MAALIMKYRIFIFLLISIGIGKSGYVYAQADPVVGIDSIEVNMRARVYEDETTHKKMYEVQYWLRRLTDWKLKKEDGSINTRGATTALYTVALYFRWFNTDETNDIWKNFVGSGDKDGNITFLAKWEWADLPEDNKSPITAGLENYSKYQFEAAYHEFWDQPIQYHGVIFLDEPPEPDYMMLFPDTETYLHLGTLTWELQPTASGKVGIWRDIYRDVKNQIQEGIIAGKSITMTGSTFLNIKYTGTGIVDLGGDLEPPVFAEDMDTVSCGRDFPWSWDYALDSENTPQGADTCIWFVKDVSLPIVAVDSGSKVTIEWPGAGDYTICAYSKNTTSGAVSDTIYQTVHIKNMPTADLDSITYACTSAAAQMAVTYTNLNPSGATTSWLDVSVGGAATLPAAPNKVYYLALDYEGCQDTLMTETRLATPSVDVNRELTACGDTINLWVNFVCRKFALAQRRQNDSSARRPTTGV